MLKNGKSVLVKAVSSLFASLLLLATGFLFLNKISIWSQIGATEHMWMIFAFTYSVVLTLSGWMFVASDRYKAGIVHSALMLGIAAKMFFEMAAGLLRNPGSDNASAGIVGAANGIYLIIAILSAFFGIAVGFVALKK